MSKELDGVLANTNQTEALVKKLDDELSEWKTPKKLCRRDQEIEAIQVKVSIALKDLAQESSDMEKELTKCTEKVQNGGSEESKKNFETCSTYVEEIKMITADFKLKQKEA